MNQNVAISADETDFSHQGYLDYISPREDTATGTVTLRGVFANSGELLSPGFFARIRVRGSAPYPALLLPDRAIATDQAQRFVWVVNLISPDRRYDSVYLSNYALLQIKDTLARLPGVGEILVFGARDYSMRLWLNPEQVAARNLTAGDVINAIREQNIQVAACVVGQQPEKENTDFQHPGSVDGGRTVRRYRHQERG